MSTVLQKLHEISKKNKHPHRIISEVWRYSLHTYSYVYAEKYYVLFLTKNEKKHTHMELHYHGWRSANQDGRDAK